MKTMLVEVITPAKEAFSGEIKSLSVPGSLGAFQVLFNHAPILSSFEIGMVKMVDTTDQEMVFATGGGTVEVLKNKIIILAESFEKPEEIDAERARSAEERARKRLSEHAKDTDLDRAELALKRALNRLKVQNRYM